MAGIAEKAGRLRLMGYSPLSSLVELESLHLGIIGKIDMWTTLRDAVGDRVNGIDFDELVRRAERQAEEVERRRLDVAVKALSDRDRSPRPTPTTSSSTTRRDEIELLREEIATARGPVASGGPRTEEA